jgi:hypothetical protein
MPHYKRKNILESFEAPSPYSLAIILFIYKKDCKKMPFNNVEIILIAQTVDFTHNYLSGWVYLCGPNRGHSLYVVCVVLILQKYSLIFWVAGCLSNSLGTFIQVLYTKRLSSERPDVSIYHMHLMCRPDFKHAMVEIRAANCRPIQSSYCPDFHLV